MRVRASVLLVAAALASALPGAAPAQPAAADVPARRHVLDAMKRATTFMVQKISTKGGYVWSYLPDLSRRWGELEARDTMIWIQPPGTATMGHVFLDAYHATGDEVYYQAAEQVAGALIRGQHPSGGWNYVVDFAGDASLREWYDTIGRNAWRLEEFQHYWGNATFDDGGTAESAKFLLRLFVEKRNPEYKAALDKAIRFVLDAQYPVGAWPQRFPPTREVSLHGQPDYTSFLTFNDDVASENIGFLILCYQALGDQALLDPIARAMDAFLATQLPPPQPGWALQYTPDLKPAGARSYEPRALATHATARNIEQLIKFYRLTGNAKYLARIPEALDWLDRVRLPANLATRGRTHPTFIELGTNEPLFVHRRGSNVVNGRYFVDRDPTNTIGHYSSFRSIDVAGLRQLYEQARALPAAEVNRDSPLRPGAGRVELPRFFAVGGPRPGGPASPGWQPPDVAPVIASLNEAGYWPAELGSTSHPYRGNGSTQVAPGDFSETLVGDDTDTSPYRGDRTLGISTAAYIRNMGVLIRYLEEHR